MARGTTVDMLSLGDFQDTLTARLAEVDRVLEKINALAGNPPAVGTFTDAQTTKNSYESVRVEFANKATRLQAAIHAAQKATAQILSNYSTTEARNKADANDISATLDDVRTSLTMNGNVNG